MKYQVGEMVSVEIKGVVKKAAFNTYVIEGSGGSMAFAQETEVFALPTPKDFETVICPTCNTEMRREMGDTTQYLEAFFCPKCNNLIET